MKGKRFSIEIKPAGSVSDTMTVTGSETEISITLDHPWAGDSQSGFGQELTSSFNREQVLELRAALDLWLEQ